MFDRKRMKVPLNAREDGALCVAGTDVTLDMVVTDFEGGAIADEIALKHPELTLSDLFLVLAYYLTHRAEVEAYIAGRNLSPAIGIPAA